LLDYLVEEAPAVTREEAESFLEELRETVRIRRSIVSPINLVEVLSRGYRASHASGGGVKLLGLLAQRLRKIYSDALSTALKIGVDLLAEYRSILTLSKSSQVISLIKRLPGVEVRVLAGWPLMDGLSALNELKASGVNARILPDSSISEALEGADVLLMGCDAVLRGGSPVNRSGSRAAAITAREAGVPVYIVCDSSKLDYEGIYSHEEWTTWVNGVEVKFKIFEEIEYSSITGIISEHGVKTPQTFVSAALETLRLTWPNRIALGL